MKFWFTPPVGVTGEPPRWKMVIVTVLVMYPLSVLLGALLSPVPAITPPLLIPLVMMGVMIPLVTYWVMPLAVRPFARWLFPGAPKR